MARRARQRWTPETPWVKSNKKTQAVWPTYVCRNRNCKSYGKSHPNCKCGAPSFAAQSRALEYDALGGEVGRHFCESKSGGHLPGCEYHLADGGEIEANRSFEENPDLALDHAAYDHGLLHLFTKTGHTRSEEPGRAGSDHLDAVRRGRRALEQDGRAAFQGAPDGCPADRATALGEHLERLTANPHEALEAGGDLENDLPDHAGLLAAKLGSAQGYFAGLKPKAQQMRPLDPVMPPSTDQEANYRRQLENAEHPRSILRRVHDGTLNPEDLRTVRALYPKLADEMTNHVGEALISAKTEGKPLSYSHRTTASLILGQPLDTTMTQSAMAACIRANAGAETTTQGAPPAPARTGSRPPSAQTQKTIAKANRLYETPLESVEIGRRR